VLGNGSGSATYPVRTVVPNPDFDVALLQTATDPVDDGGAASVSLSDVVPIQIAYMSNLAIGDAVEIAGYGLTGAGALQLLQFVVEPIVAMDSASITVDGSGTGGACAGDSGGPLLARQSDGPVVLEGLLSVGDATCRGDDTYVRIDLVSDWIDQVAGTISRVDTECGGIDQQGRCLYGSAIWCAAGKLAGGSCQNGSRCGWSEEELGFRCVDPSTDPCQGADAVGVCEGNAAVSCPDGHLERDPCNCDSCGIDGQSGVPRCGGP